MSNALLCRVGPMISDTFMQQCTLYTVSHIHSLNTRYCVRHWKSMINNVIYILRTYMFHALFYALLMWDIKQLAQLRTVSGRSRIQIQLL